MSESFQPIRISFEINDTYLLNSMRNDPERRSYRWKQFVFIAPFAAAAVTVALLSVRVHDRQLLMPASTLFAIVGIVLFRWSPKGQLKERRKQMQQLFARYPFHNKMEFGPDGFIVLGPDGVSNFHPWPTIIRVVEQVQGLAIYVQTNVRYWIPAGAFASPQDYQRTIELITREVTKVERMR